MIILFGYFHIHLEFLDDVIEIIFYFCKIKIQ